MCGWGLGWDDVAGGAVGSVEGVSYIDEHQSVLVSICCWGGW
eukprot:COSAG02_NODE_67897_length_252_cov_0.496732_1_plen_41_part_10